MLSAGLTPNERCPICNADLTAETDEPPWFRYGRWYCSEDCGRRAGCTA